MTTIVRRDENDHDAVGDIDNHDHGNNDSNDDDWLR
jgi:hypothetical protein